MDRRPLRRFPQRNSANRRGSASTGVLLAWGNADIKIPLITRFVPVLRRAPAPRRPHRLPDILHAIPLFPQSYFPPSRRRSRRRGRGGGNAIPVRPPVRRASRTQQLRLFRGEASADGAPTPRQRGQKWFPCCGKADFVEFNFLRRDEKRRLGVESRDEGGCRSGERTQKRQRGPGNCKYAKIGMKHGCPPGPGGYSKDRVSPGFAGTIPKPNARCRGGGALVLAKGREGVLGCRGHERTTRTDQIGGCVRNFAEGPVHSFSRAPGAAGGRGALPANPGLRARGGR